MTRQAPRGHACLPASASRRISKESLLEAANGFLRDPTMLLNHIWWQESLLHDCYAALGTRLLWNSLSSSIEVRNSVWPLYRICCKDKLKELLPGCWAHSQCLAHSQLLIRACYMPGKIVSIFLSLFHLEMTRTVRYMLWLPLFYREWGRTERLCNLCKGTQFLAAVLGYRCRH